MQSRPIQAAGNWADPLREVQPPDVKSNAQGKGAGVIYEPPAIKWGDIVQEIVDHGYSIYRIAKELNLAECTVRNWWKHEGEPKFGNGCVLLDLHKNVCRTTTDSSHTTTNMG
jgi:hypothetical protein